MPDPSLWFGQLASLPGAMPKTKLISLAWSLPIFSSFFECSPTMSIPACPVTKAAHIIASSFPQLSEGRCLNHCALFLSQDTHSPGLEAAWVARTQGLAFPRHAVPTAVGLSTYGPYWHQLPTWIAAIASFCGALSAARHLTRPALCLPGTHHLVAPVAPITCSMCWSVQCLVLAFPHLASVPGCCVQNLMCCDGNAACSTENLGSLCVPSCLSYNLPPFTTHRSVLISRSFIYVSHLLN